MSGSRSERRGVRFTLLGTVDVTVAGERIDLRAAKLRTVLALLLLGRGSLVSDSRIAEMLWGHTPPVTADAQIQTYVSRLRKILGETCTITRLRPGYVLDVGPARLDLVEFERVAAAGRQAAAAGRTAEAADLFARALGEWTGPALAGVTDCLEAVAAPDLEERRLVVLEERVAADIELDRHGGLVAELTGLVGANPLRERLRGQLMTVLDRTGRQAEALSCYHEHRRRLAVEMGIDPGAELREIYRRVLASTPAKPARPLPRTQHQVPAQLPPDIADFTGRTDHLATLEALLRPDPDRSSAAAAVISGMAGVGKTALAVHAGHRLRAGFPDGQCYLDLRGTSAPVRPHDALAKLLTGLGVPARDVPSDVDERVRLYRSRLADRRVLVVLDNAVGEQQIRPLLPGNPQCGVLVTGRARLSALPGVPVVDLGVLSQAESLELLSRIVSKQRIQPDPRSAERIARLCGGLPLAVRIAGARLVAKPHLRPVELAGRLADRGRRLDELQLADLDVRASVGLSYRSLGTGARRAFRLLALLERATFSVWNAAVVLDVTVGEARELTEQLVDARLLEVPDQDRYAYHDLVRAVAMELVAEEDLAVDRFAALHRAHASMEYSTE
ncbi:hypothetical protein GCM10022243_13970 [Saccharothrix violaceirubra]|uniref:DNA-binding SARP family transcriptional activator n=1 Tax=Saccharothrix violaceirubra TaxID=413306 RepID=A0A7W7T6K1_9PSEU|nr:AfsR/SARP family transcriptional regulator [Saccharothrix violaceirubra]MBB4967271.1 DNA-binding SARP family transcriptional activator [Saccharothrix violaceirubra]